MPPAATQKKKKTVIEELKESGVEPCAKCVLLGHISPETHSKILLTLSPNPQWKEYSERLPDTQKKLIDNVLENKQIMQKLQKYFGHYRVLSTHYEFAKNGNLHTHSIVEIPKQYEGYLRNLMTISKVYHREIGLAYNNSQISANTKWINDADVAIYLNKENAYEPYHNSEQYDIHQFLIKGFESL